MRLKPNVNHSISFDYQSHSHSVITSRIVSGVIKMVRELKVPTETHSSLFPNLIRISHRVFANSVCRRKVFVWDEEREEGSGTRVNKLQSADTRACGGQSMFASLQRPPQHPMIWYSFAQRVIRWSDELRDILRYNDFFIYVSLI